MKIAELTAYLDSRGIRRDAYFLNGTSTGEEHCIDHGPKGWSVFYHERGLRTSESIYRTEEEAASELIRRLESDKSCYRKNEK